MLLGRIESRVWELLLLFALFCSGSAAQPSMTLANDHVASGMSGPVLGISAPRHDAAAALLGEKGIAAAIEESKLLRSRSSSGIPHAAIRFCLDKIQNHEREINIVAIASRPVHSFFRQMGLSLRLKPFSPLGGAYSQTDTISEVGLELSSSRTLRDMTGAFKPRLIRFEHHLCHAASAFYASPFDRALILTMDERGDGYCGAVALGEGNQLRILQRTSLPHSLGWLYSQITNFLGFKRHREEHKTQWLSLDGEPVFRDVFLDMLRDSSNGTPQMNASYFKRHDGDHAEFSDKFYRSLELPAKNPSDIKKQHAASIASSLQIACSTLISELLEFWRKREGATHLCLGGGLFLNPLLVSSAEKNTDFEGFFVQPAAGNAGCALGAAWLAWHQILGNPRQQPISHVYWGPSYAPEQVKQVLDNCKARYRWFVSEDERNQETVRLLHAGKIVAWYQGAAEFGPRALGNRSLLASPWAPYVRENLNDYVKHRESFQPFAIAVPEEDCPRYFECSRLGRFMTSVAWAKPAAAELIKDFVLPGNRVRLHVVQRSENPSFWRLLKKFGERAPAPLLVNTSFNLFGEPLVISPRDAVRSFFCSGIDALVIHTFLLVK